MADHESFGRGETIRRVSTAACSGGVVVIGPPGSGVSTVVRLATRSAEHQGRSIRFIRCPDDREDVISTCEPDLLVVDDAHRATDRQILDLRDAAMRRPTILGVRSGASPESLAWLWRSGAIDRVHVEPLDRSSLRALVESRADGVVHRALVERIAVRSGCLPGFVVDKIESMRDASAMVFEHGHVRFAPTGSIGRRVIERACDLLHSLPAAVARDVTLVAFVGCLPVALAAGLDVDIAELRRRRLVDDDSDGTCCRVAPPMLERALRELVQPDEAATLVELVIPELGRLNVDDRVRLMMSAGADVELADVGASAWRSLRRSDPLTATALACHAATKGAGGLLIEAQILVEVGRRDEAAERYASLLGDETLAEELRALAAVEYSLLLLWDLGRAVEATHIAEGLADVTRGGASEAVGRVHLASVKLFNGHPLDALALLDGVDVPALTEPLCGAAELARVVSLALTEPHTVHAVDELSVLMAHPVDLAANSVEPAIRVVAGALALELAGELEAAAALVERETTPGGWTGTPVASAWIALAEARVELAIGRPAAARLASAEAMAGFAHANHPSGMRWAVGGALLAAALDGDAAECRRLTTVFEALRPGVAFLDSDLLRARAWAAWATGDSVESASRMREAIDLSCRQGAIGLEAIALHDSYRMFRSPVRDRLVELAKRSDAPAVVLRAQHVQMVGARVPEALLWLAEQFERHGVVLIAAEVAADAASIARSDGLRSVARTADGLRIRLSDRCGNPRTPSLENHGPTRLTPREHDIATHASQGLTSREIATRLGLSQRTVDNLLQRVYIKLGVHGRSELAGRFGALDGDTPASMFEALRGPSAARET